MDWEYIKRNGYAAWQVIPLFFTTYIGMALFFGGCVQISWPPSDTHRHNVTVSTRDRNFSHESWTLLICGACVLSLAIIYSIAVCLILPIMNKRRQRSQHVHAPEPETGSVEGVMQTWFASSVSDVQEVLSHTVQHR